MLWWGCVHELKVSNSAHPSHVIALLKPFITMRAKTGKEQFASYPLLIWALIVQGHFTQFENRPKSLISTSIIVRWEFFNFQTVWTYGKMSGDFASISSDFTSCTEKGEKRNKSVKISKASFSGFCRSFVGFCCSCTF